MNNLYSFNRKSSYKNWQKWRRNYKKYVLRIKISLKCKIYGKFISKSFFLKEFTELNVNMDKMIKNVNIAESNISIATVILNIQTLKKI